MAYPQRSLAGFSAGLMLLGFALFAVTACDSVEPLPEPIPPDTPRTQLLTQSPWQLQQHTFLEGGGTEVGVASRYEFRPGGTLRTTFERPGQPDAFEEGRWTISVDEATIILFQQSPSEADAGTLTIRELSASRFVFDTRVTQGLLRIELSR